MLLFFKRMRNVFLCFCLLWSRNIIGFSVPYFTQPVTYQTGILISERVQDLNQALSALYESGGPQIAVLTTESLENQTQENASIESKTSKLKDWASSRHFFRFLLLFFFYLPILLMLKLEQSKNSGDNKEAEPQQDETRGPGTDDG